MAIGAFRRGLKPYIEEALEKVPDLYNYSYAAVKATVLKLEQDLPQPKDTSPAAVQELPTANSSTLTDDDLSKTENFAGPLAPTETVDGVVERTPSKFAERQQKATSALIQLIPQQFKTTPGLKKPLLWYSAIKYLDSLIGQSHLTPFDVIPNAEATSENKALTRTILFYMTPAQYHPKKGGMKLADDPILYTAESAAEYIRRYLETGTQYKIQKPEKKLASNIQTKLRATLDVKVDDRKKIQAVSQVKARTQAKEVASTEKPAAKPVQAAKPAPAVTPAGPRVVTRSMTAAKSAAKLYQPVDYGATLRRVEASALVKKASLKVVPKNKVDWGDDDSVIAHAEEKIKSIAAAVAKLKGVVREQES